MLTSLVLCSRQFFQLNKASVQRTSSTIIHLKFKNVLNNTLFVLLVLFLTKLKKRLIFSHVGRHLEFLELPKGYNSTPTWILLFIIHPKDI